MLFPVDSAIKTFKLSRMAYPLNSALTFRFPLSVRKTRIAKTYHSQMVVWDLLIAGYHIIHVVQFVVIKTVVYDNCNVVLMQFQICD